MQIEVLRLKSLARELVETWSSAWDSKDTQSASRFYSKDPAQVFFDLGPIHFGWDQYKKSVEQSFATIDSLKLSLAEDMKVVIRGSIGLTISTGHISYKMKDGTLYDSDVRFSGVWENDAGDWRLIHEHWSHIVRQTPDVRRLEQTF